MVPVFCLREVLCRRWTGRKRRSLLLTLRCEPDFNDFLRQNYQAVAPGYYSNKALWNTVWFRLEDIPERDRNPQAPPVFPEDAVVREMTDRSWRIMAEKLPKQRRATLEKT